MNGNLYRSAVAVILAMLLLSVVVYFALRAQTTILQINDKANEETQVLGKSLQHAKNVSGLQTRRRG